MKQSKRIALCGVVTALSVVFMLMSIFPYLTIALPAIAGALFMIVMVELDTKWALGSYAAAAILSLLLCGEKEAPMLFTCFFGYYPVVKGYLEKFSSRIVEYVCKFLLFNLAVIAAYSVLTFVFQIPFEGLGDFGKYTLYILLGLGNVMFIVYDLALSRLYSDYMFRLHGRVAKMLK